MATPSPVPRVSVSTWDEGLPRGIHLLPDPRTPWVHREAVTKLGDELIGLADPVRRSIEAELGSHWPRKVTSQEIYLKYDLPGRFFSKPWAYKIFLDAKVLLGKRREELLQPLVHEMIHLYAPIFRTGDLSDWQEALEEGFNAWLEARVMKRLGVPSKPVDAVLVGSFEGLRVWKVIEKKLGAQAVFEVVTAIQSAGRPAVQWQVVEEIFKQKTGKTLTVWTKGPPDPGSASNFE